METHRQHTYKLVYILRNMFSGMELDQKINIILMTVVKYEDSTSSLLRQKHTWWLMVPSGTYSVPDWVSWCWHHIVFTPEVHSLSVLSVGWTVLHASSSRNSANQSKCHYTLHKQCKLLVATHACFDIRTCNSRHSRWICRVVCHHGAVSWKQNSEILDNGKSNAWRSDCMFGWRCD